MVESEILMKNRVSVIQAHRSVVLCLWTMTPLGGQKTLSQVHLIQKIKILIL